MLDLVLDLTVTHATLVDFLLARTFLDCLELMLNGLLKDDVGLLNHLLVSFEELHLHPVDVNNRQG